MDVAFGSSGHFRISTTKGPKIAQQMKKGLWSKEKRERQLAERDLLKMW